MAVVLFSCSDDDDGNEPECTDTPISFTNLEKEYGCINTKRDMDIDLDNNFVIISSQAAFDALVTGTCMPEIDFAEFDLVIGKQFLNTGNDTIEYALAELCEDEGLQLVVTFNQNNTSEAPNLTYHILAPKLDNPERLEVEIIIN
jgi:hypothetical protein